jgi:hypothetical protein
MGEEERSFLDRWARQKQAARKGPKVGAETEDPADPRPSSVEVSEGQPVAVEKLPDIDSLTVESDFSVFLRAGVPEELRQRALRKLWRLDPVFANLDGLNDYDRDYRSMSAGVKGLKTLYQIGKGMIGAPQGEVRPPPEAEIAPVAQVNPSAAQPEALEHTDEQPQDLGEPIQRPPPATRDAAQFALPTGARSAVERRWEPFKS